MKVMQFKISRAQLTLRASLGLAVGYKLKSVCTSVPAVFSFFLSADGNFYFLRDFIGFYH